MMLLVQALGYLGTALALLVALVLVGLGVGWVRPANPTAGWAIAAAGLFRAVTLVGLQGAWTILEWLEAYRALRWLTIAVTPVEHVVFWGLLLFAAISIARARTPMGPRPPDQPSAAEAG